MAAPAIMNRLIGGLALLALTGCMQATGPQVSASGPASLFTRSAPDSLALAGGAVVVAGPKGYCVDKPASQLSRDGGIVLMASCAAINGSGQGETPVVPALLTASVTAEATGLDLSSQSDGLKRFFASAAGRAALARDGNADSVRILKSFPRDGAFYIHASDRSEGVGEGLTQDYWRAILDVNGRMVSASVVGFADLPISESAGEATLLAFVGRIKRESVAPAATPVAAAAPKPRPVPKLLSILGVKS